MMRHNNSVVKRTACFLYDAGPTASRAIPEKGTLMNPVPVSPAAPATEGLTPRRADAHAEPKNDRPNQESRSNAFKHGCSGTGAILTPRDRKKARRLFRLLCDEYQPKTQYQKKLLRDRANAEVLAERCQEVLYSLQETAIREASLHWNTNQTMAAQQLLSRLPKTPALICLQLSKTPQGLAILEN